MKQVMVIIAIAVLAITPAAAQVVDWDLDIIGVFIDEDATVTATSANVGETVHAYLVAGNLTVGGAATAFEGGFYFVSPIGEQGWPVFDEYLVPVTLPFTATVRGDGVNTMPAYCSGLDHAVCFDIAFPVPLPLTTNTVLADFEIPIDTTDALGVYNTWGGGMLYPDGGSPVLLNPSTRDISHGMPPFYWLEATINSDYEPVSDEKSAWGAVKAIYR